MKSEESKEMDAKMRKVIRLEIVIIETWWTRRGRGGIEGERDRVRERERDRERDREDRRETDRDRATMRKKESFFVCLVGFLTSSSVTRL